MGEEKKTEKEKKENIWPAEEKKTEENIWRRKIFGQRRRRRTGREKKTIFGIGKSDDGQMDRQTEFPLVDSTPSVEGVE